MYACLHSFVCESGVCLWLHCICACSCLGNLVSGRLNTEVAWLLGSHIYLFASGRAHAYAYNPAMHSMLRINDMCVRHILQPAQVDLMFQVIYSRRSQEAIALLGMSECDFGSEYFSKVYTKYQVRVR